MNPIVVFAIIFAILAVVPYNRNIVRYVFGALSIAAAIVNVFVTLE